jgi:hypothetical protein
MTRLLVVPFVLTGGLLAVAGCGGSSSTGTSGTTASAASPVAEAVVALNHPDNGLSTAWAESGGGGGTAANLAAPSVILAPGYTCQLVVTNTGVSLFLQEPGDRLPNVFDWTRSGGVVSQPSVPASAPKGGTPCTLNDSWVIALK